MNWKTFLTAFINITAICLPYNIIGCASDGIDPHDYFVSFFDKNLSADSTLKPFYYTNYQFLYDSEETMDVSRLTSAEWVGYSGKPISTDDAYDFVCKINVQHLSALYQHIENKVPLAIPDSVMRNGLTKYFIEKGDREALGYLMFARKLEPHVTGSWTGWEPIERDSAVMSKLIRNGEQLYAVAKKDFIKLRYAYQLVRLAHYSKRYEDCIKWYDQYIKMTPATGTLSELSMSLKAGALLRLGKKNEAAYEFSKLFSRNKFNRISNYMSFDWSVKRFDESNRLACLQLCKNDAEKADLLGLFALGSNEDELKTLEQIYKLSPASKLLELLTIREIHKLEENYFTPALAFSSGKELSVIGYERKSEKDSSYIIARKELTGFVELCKRIAVDQRSGNRNMYSIAAAHAAMIGLDNNNAAIILKSIKQQELTTALKDQWNMTNILVTINAKDSMSPAFEHQLLTSVKWLESKARNNKEYQKFYRRLFADVLAAKYQRMKGPDQVKYLLCKGVADNISKSSEDGGWGYSSALDHLRNQVEAPRVELLIQLMENKKQSAFEKFLVANSDFNRDDLNDIAGTTWLRQFNFIAAENWFAKIPAKYYQQEPFKTYLAANPFADLILDTHASTRQDTVTYTKLSFTRKMIALEKRVTTATTGDQKAIAYYELAKGCYHMSYWGNSWLLVAYAWSSYHDLSPGSVKESDDYWSVNRAKDYYLKAYNGSTDRNLKAKALFMAAKCDQKTHGNLPNYFSSGDMKEYKAAISKWVNAFDKKNKYFSTLGKEYTNTPFYKEVLRSCSFLEDFVIRGNRK